MNKILLVLLLIVGPYVSLSQKVNENGRIAIPEWAAKRHFDGNAHAYFPDYYTYYDAKRKGYVFWDKGHYSFTPALPPFLEKVDMGKTRLKILKGLSLDLCPWQNYPYYMKMYPAERGDNNVPVPR